jgi:rod shape-determining protein MreC
MIRFIYTKTFLAFATVLVLVALLFILQVKGWLQPIQYALIQAPRPVANTARAIAEPVRTFFTTLASLRSVVRENGELRAQVAQLQLAQVQFDKLRTDNDLLRNELKLQAQSPLVLEACTVLSIDPQELSDAMVLSCGSGQGISEGQAVLSQGYLIAKVAYVGKDTSTAILISNAQSSVDARLSKNNTEGVVKGSFGSGMVFDLVSQNAEVASGDLVVTAGINSKIPKDLLIGEVGQVLSGPNDLFKKMSVTSPLRFRATEFVFVVKQ